MFLTATPQFRALSDQLYGVPDHHLFVRARVVERLRSEAQHYRGFVPSDYAQYVDSMARPGTWGDHLTLQCCADVFGTEIRVLTSYERECVITVDPVAKMCDRTLWLSFWAEVHYNSLYPREEPPRPPSPTFLGSSLLHKVIHNPLKPF